MQKIELCKIIQSNINNLSQNEIDELFKILHKNNTNYTKNNNGVFVNLNWLDFDILNQINNYISFCIKSQKEINKYEVMRNILTDNMVKDKEIHIIDNKPHTTQTNQISNNSNLNKQLRTSSSMKFYLLKKKYLKQNIISNLISFDNKLTHEEYII